LGHDVIGVDSDDEKIEMLRRGTTPFFEPGLEDLVGEEIAAGRLSFENEPAGAVRDAEVVFICVGTPARASGEANLSAVEQAARSVAAHAEQPIVVVEKSTVPAGTAERVKRTAVRERPDLIGQIEVASNPEFLREGRAVEDSLEPNRILVGAESEWAFERLREVYKPLVDRGHRLIETDIKTAELAKHACNAFLALKISYANALARICERAGADILDVAEVMGSDPRIGPEFIKAGLGYGGYCFPKDIQAFERLSARLGYRFPLLNEIARINDEAVTATLDKIEDALWNLEGKRVTLLGLAFKPGTDDTRFSPALALAVRLLAEGVEVIGFDPEASANAKSEVPDLQIAPSPYEAAQGAHCVVLCTEWDEFSSLDLERLHEVMTYNVLVDGRNFIEVDKATAAGFDLYPTGRLPRS
jgi:UDPglucose 6-dehydrogenase